MWAGAQREEGCSMFLICDTKNGFFFYYDKRKDAYTIYLLAGFLAYLPIIIIIAIFFFNRQQLATHSWFSFLFFFFLFFYIQPSLLSFLPFFWHTHLDELVSRYYLFFFTFFLYNFLFNNCKLVMMGNCVCFNQKNEILSLVVYILVLFEAISTWNVV